MLLNRFNGVENISFELHKVDEENLKDFKEFLSICESDGSVNNSSLSKLKFGKWGKEEAWWFIKTDGKIVSMSGSHYLPQVSPNCYMIGYRAYTLKKWRGTCCSTKDHRMLNEFHHGAIQPFAVDWAKSRGADTIVTTINTSKNNVPDPNNLDYKMYRVARIMFAKKGKYTLLHTNYPLYNSYQDIWKLNYRDFKTMEPL
jgi:hypothetical protein